MKLFPIDSSFFKVDYKRLVLLLLPTFLRQPRLFAFLSAMVSSISKLHEELISKRKKYRQQLLTNGQVCYLRGLLNDRLDPFESRIYITDGKEEGDWLWAMDEEEPYQLLIDASLDNLLFDEALLINNTAFFNVFVPFAKEDVNAMNLLKNLLNEYKLVSKKYRIYEQAKF